MSDHQVPVVDGSLEGVSGLLSAVTAAIRAPVSVSRVGASAVYRFTPDLTAAEAARFADLASNVPSRLLSAAAFAAVESRLANLRTFAQQTQAEFMALTATQRDRAQFDATTDLIRVVLRMLRD